MPPTPSNVIARLIAWVCISLMVAFLINNYLIFWHGWGGALSVFDGNIGFLSGLQLLSYIIAIAAPCYHVWRSIRQNCIADYHILYNCSLYIARASFWAVLIIGITDVSLSVLRSENWLILFFGDNLGDQLTRSAIRGPYLHMPLIALSLIIAWKNKNLGFHWLALLVVIAEFMIVICRFIFSYEQPYMGDLVRFWYAALFLFASAYTLWHEGHVRVDVFYTKFSDSKKAKTNALGCILLGLPICWVILVRGMWDKTHVINAPLLNFEVSQSGFGMYVKYLMAGFLIIYAITMMLSFCAYMLKNVALLNGDEKPPEEVEVQAEI